MDLSCSHRLQLSNFFIGHILSEALVTVKTPDD